MAPIPASTMLSGVAKSGSPISRWTMRLPSASSLRARASVSNAPSVPRRDMRSANRTAVLIRLESYWAPPHSWGGGGRSPPEGNCGLLAIHGEVAGAARRRGTVGSSPFMGRWRAQPAGGALWAPPHSWGGGGRSPPEGLVDPDQRSAINTERLARDVARLARAEESTRGADLAGFAEPLHGRPLLHLRQIAEAAQGVRADGIWREAVDRYPVGRELQRQRLRHPGDRGPQRVREDESWNRLADRDGGDEDDPALVRFLEVRQRRRHQAHRAHQRQLIRLVPTIERRGLERPGRRPTRVHDKDVETAHLSRRRPDEHLYVGLLRHVGGHRAMRADLAAGFLDRLCVPRRDDNAGLLGDQRLRACPAEPLARRRDNRAPPGQPEIHADSW